MDSGGHPGAGSHTAHHSQCGCLCPGCDLGRPIGKPFMSKCQPGLEGSLPRILEVKVSGGGPRDRWKRARAVLKGSSARACGAWEKREARACLPSIPRRHHAPGVGFLSRGPPPQPWPSRAGLEGNRVMRAVRTQASVQTAGIFTQAGQSTLIGHCSNHLPTPLMMQVSPNFRAHQA